MPQEQIVANKLLNLKYENIHCRVLMWAANWQQCTARWLHREPVWNAMYTSCTTVYPVHLRTGNSTHQQVGPFFNQYNENGPFLPLQCCSNAHTHTGIIYENSVRDRIVEDFGNIAIHDDRPGTAEIDIQCRSREKHIIENFKHKNMLLWQYNLKIQLFSYYLIR